jgi:hypothetical protein
MLSQIRISILYSSYKTLIYLYKDDFIYPILCNKYFYIPFNVQEKIKKGQAKVGTPLDKLS